MAREKISEIRNKYPYMFLTEYFVRENNIVEETPYLRYSSSIINNSGEN